MKANEVMSVRNKQMKFLRLIIKLNPKLSSGEAGQLWHIFNT